MYLKILIIIILIIIITILFLKNSKNEHLNINLTKDNTTKFVNLVKEYNDTQSIRKFSDIQVLNKFMINNVELKDIIINIKYPIGCYYIQYPENNTNLNEQDDLEVDDMDTTFPLIKSPEALFGGKWEEQYNGDSVFFRTGGILSEDSRLNGIQPYAMKKIYGYTSVAQTNLWNPGFGSQGILEESNEIKRIKTDGKPDSPAFIRTIVAGVFVGLAGVLTILTFGAASPLFLATIGGISSAALIAGTVILSKRAIAIQNSTDWLYFGPPGKPGDTVDAKKGKIVSDRGTDYGHQNLMDPSLQSPVSPTELRVRNRIMKVWKRIG
jgi:hypothetical protein